MDEHEVTISITLKYKADDDTSAAIEEAACEAESGLRELILQAGGILIDD